MKNWKGWKKRIFALLLAGAMLGTSIDLSAWTIFAADSEVLGVSVETQPVVEWKVYCSEEQVGTIAQETLGAATPAGGQNVKYIDRVSLSTQAKSIYNQLEDSLPTVDSISGQVSNGLLVDPVQGSILSISNGTAQGTYYTLAPVEWTIADGADVDTACNDMTEEITTAYAAFLRDHPEVFWFSGTAYVLISQTSNTDGSTTCNLYFVLKKTAASDADSYDIRKPDYQNVSKLQSEIQIRDVAVSTILNKVDEDASAYEKVAFFNEWLTKNNCYNSMAAENGSGGTTAWECISALTAAKPADIEYTFDVTSPVCEGYAKAFKVLCDQAGIPCVLVSGTAKNSSDDGQGEAHMWNYVQIDGAWYAVDVTWNDPVVDEIDNVLSGKENINYLLVGSTTVIDEVAFAQSHQENNQVMENGYVFTGGPVIETKNYTLPPFKSISIKLGTAECTDVDTYNVTYGVSDYSKRTFTATVMDYNGNEVTDGVTYSWTEGESSVEGGKTFTVPLDAHAGDHTYTLTVTKTENNETKSMSRSIKVYVLKADPIVAEPVKTQTATYGQTLADFKLPIPDTNKGETAGSWKWEDGDTASVGDVSSSPVVHRAVFTPSDTNNYNTKTVDVSFTVSPATYSIKILDIYQTSRSYNGDPLQEPTKSELELIGMEYSEVKFEWYKDVVSDSNKLDTAPTEAGTYVLRAYVDGTSNHSEASDQKTVTITRETTQITVAPEYQSYPKVYGEPKFTLSGISNNKNAPMTYTSSNTDVVTVNPTTGEVTIVGAGEATITVKVEKETYVEEATNDSIKITVDKKPITVTIKGLSMVNGESTPITFDWEESYKDSLEPGDTIEEFGEVIYTIYKRNEDGSNGEEFTGVQLETGTYNVCGTFTNSDNYTVTCNPGVLTVYADKGTVEMKEGVVLTKTFDNEPFHNLVRGTDYTTNSGADATFSYRLYSSGMTNEQGNYTGGMPTDAGTYVVRLSVPATEGYTEAVAYTMVTITPLALTSNPLNWKVIDSNPTLTYDGLSHTVTEFQIEVTIKDGVTYTLKSDSFDFVTGNPDALSGNEWRNAGTYTLYITAKGNCTGTVSTTYTVNPADAPNPPSSTITTAYDKKDKTVADVELPTDWSWDATYAASVLLPGESNAVTAIANYKNDNKNYNTVSVTITMQQCNHPTTSQIIDNQPTCTATGTAHTVCDICGETRQTDLVVSALGHTGGTATCTEQAVCDRCHQPYGELNLSNHVHTKTINQKAATCTEAGYTGDTYCDDCKTIIVRGSSIPALGHSGGTATCSAKAVCDRCHQPYGELNPSNHTGSKVTGQKAATCTENGYTGDTVCTGCGAVLSQGKSIPALGHSYTSSVTREPTTEQEGERTYTCSRCGDSYTENIEKLPKEMGLTGGTWELDGGKWWYAAADGSYPSNGWSLVEGEWYAFDNSGYMQTGWYQDGGSWYYLNNSGVMQTGWVGDGGTWYYMEDSGAMATGWTRDGNDWYYMDSSGAMCTGWKQIGGIWYYLSGSGAMVTGWQQIGGTWYYFDAGGAMQTGWQKNDDVWYYLKPSGAMSTGWEKVGTTWYYFDASGAMVTGWSRIGASWYYFYDSGAMAADTTIDGYRLSSSGAMY